MPSKEKRDAREDRTVLEHYPIEPCLEETAQRILNHWITRAEAAEEKGKQAVVALLNISRQINMAHSSRENRLMYLEQANDLVLEAKRILGADDE